MAISNSILVDTNVLVYASDKSSSFYKVASNIRNKGLNGEINICICPQILSEFFTVITSPNRVENPKSQKQARTELEKYLKAENIEKIYPGINFMDYLMDILRRYKISKQEIFDAQLIATMLLNGISKIYTFNKKHFSKFKEIKVIDL